MLEQAARARKKASAILQSRMGNRTRTRKQRDASIARRKLVGKLRKKEEIGKDDLALLTRTQIKSAVREARMTPFQALFSRLGFRDAMEVFELATDAERQEVLRLFAAKARRARDVTKAERERFLKLVKKED